MEVFLGRVRSTFSEMVPKSVLVSVESGRNVNLRPSEAPCVVTFLRTPCLVAVLALAAAPEPLAAASRAPGLAVGGLLPSASPLVEHTDPGPQEPWFLGSRHTVLGSRGPGLSCFAGMWDLPGPGAEPVSLALQSGVEPLTSSKALKLTVLCVPYILI